MNIVTDNLGQLIDAPNGIKRLRELILQLAVQGKLVEQRPEEGTADELLKQIKEAKRKDAEARKKRGERVRKTKPLPPIGKNEIPFDIPKDWKWVRLGELSSFENGDRSKRYPNTTDLKTSGVPFFGAKDMVNGVLRFDNGLRFISNEKFEELSNGKLMNNDFVILLRGTVGKIARFSETSEFQTGFINAQMLIVRLIKQGMCNFFSLYSTSVFFQSMVIGKTTGSAIRQMPANVLPNFIFPLPPLAEQKRIVAKVDELMAWCDELDALKQKRDTLRRAALKASLHELTQDRRSDVPVAWPRTENATGTSLLHSSAPNNEYRTSNHEGQLTSSFEIPCSLFDILRLIQKPEHVKQLRDAILQLAVQGRLVPQRPEEGTADELLQQIQKAKAADLARRKANGERIRKTKPLPPITEEEIPFDIPKSWKWVQLPDLYSLIPQGTKKMKSKDVLEDGEYPVVDQGQSFIAGYTNDSDKLIVIEHPVIIFGDHTRNMKLIDFNFVVGADGVKILSPYLVNPKYFYLTLRSYDLDDRGYGRHYKILSSQIFPLPPLAEQQRIVKKVDELMAWCDELEALLQTQQETATRFAAAIAKA